MAHSEAIVVLAAGRGRRMGVPKALMDVAGRAWWRRQIEAIERSGRRSVWVVSERVRDAIGQHLAEVARVVCCDDRAPMFESVRAGIETLEADPPTGVFIQPVDVPVGESATLDALGGSGVVTVPCYGGVHGHPIRLDWLWLREAMSEALEPRLDRLTENARVVVEVADPRVSMNLNRPEDVRAYERFLRNPPA